MTFYLPEFEGKGTDNVSLNLFGDLAVPTYSLTG